MKITRIVTGDLEQNTYLVTDENTKQGILIDAGDYSSAILTALSGYRIVYIFLTHTHYDHILGLSDVYQKTGATVVVHQHEADIVEHGKMNPPKFPLKSGKLPCILDAVLVKGGEHFDVGDLHIELFSTPGHTSGSMCVFVNKKALFSGDTLFATSVGRTDLPTGSHDDLMLSIQKLFELPFDVVVYPGHGKSTTIERRKEDFLLGNLY